MKIYKFKCKSCGATRYEKIGEHTYKCQYCGYKEEVFFEKDFEPEVEEVEEESPSPVEYKIPKYSLIKMIMCILFGYIGVHKFMEGKIVTGIIYMFTSGLFGIGYIVDLIIIISEFVKEYQNINKGRLWVKKIFWF